MPKHAAAKGRTPSVTGPPAEATLRLRIITESRRHFLAHGFRSVTMDDLAHELAMSKKTLYACFPSKAALLEAVILQKFQGVDADLGRIASEASFDSLSTLHRLLACVQGHMDEIQPPFVRDIRREAPDLFQVVESRRQDVIQRHFGKVFQQGRKAGLIRQDIPPRLAIEILLGAVHAIMNPSKMEALDLTPQSGFSAIIRVVLEGLLTEQGRSAR